MGGIFSKIRKVFRCRVLWAVLGFAWVIYFCLAIFGGASNLELIFKLIDWGVPLLLFCVVVLVLYLAGIEKDFFRGFRWVFARKGKGIARMELQRAARAFQCAEKTAVVASIIVVMLCVMDVLLNTRIPDPDSMDLFWMRLSIPLCILSGYVVCSAAFILLLMPVKARLEKMVLSYMEEPEDSGKENDEAQRQRLYFSLRALGLTDRETEVARLAALGMSNVEIGRDLYISVSTVKKHMTHILEKMQCGDREALAERVKGL